MPILADTSLAGQARLVFRRAGYDRHGSKSNRKLQINRACSVMDWIERHCRIHHLGQLGSNQVIRFWKAHRHLADKTANDYWLALCTVWKLTGKAGKPPRRWTLKDAQSAQESAEE
jgi:hypothetical protein